MVIRSTPTSRTISHVSEKLQAVRRAGSGRGAEPCDGAMGGKEDARCAQGHARGLAGLRLLLCMHLGVHHPPPRRQRVRPHHPRVRPLVAAPPGRLLSPRSSPRPMHLTCRARSVPGRTEALLVQHLQLVLQSVERERSPAGGVANRHDGLAPVLPGSISGPPSTCGKKGGLSFFTGTTT